MDRSTSGLAALALVVALLLAAGASVFAGLGPEADSAMRRAPSAKAWAPKSLDVRFVMAINEVRREHDRQPLTVDARLQRSAQEWSRAMADGLFLAHAPDIGSDAPPATLLVGENVGRGASVATLMEAFEASPDHLDNLLAANWTHIGVGTVRAADDRLYTTHRFAERALPPT